MPQQGRQRSSKPCHELARGRVKATGTLGVVGAFVPKNPDAEDGRAGSAVEDGIARTNSALHGTAIAWDLQGCE